MSMPVSSSHLRDYVLALRDVIVNGRPYKQGVNLPELPALTGKDCVSALLSLALQLKEIEAELIKEAVGTMALTM